MTLGTNVPAGICVSGQVAEAEVEDAGGGGVEVEVGGVEAGVGAAA